MNTSKSPIIRRLPQQTINLIAAGEVVERPASIVKELIENALDAGASAIEIRIQNGGMDQIIIKDNGCGIAPEDVPLALERHATSKLQDDNLFQIDSFGFRGEALASIVAVSDFRITTRAIGADTTWQSSFVAGKLMHEGPVKPTFSHGTEISISKLFHNIPARRSFLRSVSAETQAAIQICRSYALAHPHHSFQLHTDEKLRFDLKAYPKEQEDALALRICDLMGEEFFENSISAKFEHPTFPLKLEGRISIPTHHQATGNHMHIFINHRPVKDKNIAYILRSAYGDTLPKGRYPALVLFIEIDSLLIDVNAHPAKTEIRLRQPLETRNVLRHAIKTLLQGAPVKVSQDFSKELFDRLSPQKTYKKEPLKSSAHFLSSPTSTPPSSFQLSSNKRKGPHKEEYLIHDLNRKTIQPIKENTLAPAPLSQEELIKKAGPLGIARGQILGNYIIAENEEGLVIVDQHAAHERILYEKIKQEYLEKQKIPSQNLLAPPILSCNSQEIAQMLMDRKVLFEKFGFQFELYNENKIRVMAMPVMLKDASSAVILKDILELLEDIEKGEEEDALEDALQNAILEVLARRACHKAIRGFHPLAIEEMQHLLNQIETTPLSSQCNHGRPAFITLTQHDFELLFERK